MISPRREVDDSVAAHTDRDIAFSQRAVGEVVTHAAPINVRSILGQFGFAFNGHHLNFHADNRLHLQFSVVRIEIVGSPLGISARFEARRDCGRLGELPLTIVVDRGATANFGRDVVPRGHDARVF